MSNQTCAAEVFRHYGAAGGGAVTPLGAAAHPIGASAPDPRRPVAGRTDGRVGPSASSLTSAASAQAGASTLFDGVAA